jgi:rod shape-determining protein MreC
MFKNKKKSILKYLAVIGLLIFLHYTKILLPIEKGIMHLVNPLAGGFYSFSSNIKVAYKDSLDKRDLQKIINEQEETIKELTVENAKLSDLIEENDKLRHHLKFLESNDYDYVLANVISGGIFLSSDEEGTNIIIDKGSDDGLISGLAALDSKGIMIGKILEVKAKTSKISLTTSGNCKLAATMLTDENRSGTSGVTEGDMGLTIKMQFVPQSENVKEGDIVISSGLEENIPHGLVIGKVIRVEKDSNEVWQSLVIESIAELDELRIVSLIKPYQ